MDIKSKRFEEKIRDIDFTNQSINRYVAYSNILTTGCEYLKDNGVTSFFLIDYINDTDSAKLIDKESFI